MAAEIKMPQLSDTMSSGKILEWRKAEGDTIQRGDILAEVETDKANLEIESFNQGTLLKILVPAGTVANVGDVIAFIGKVGEELAHAPKSNGAPAGTPYASSAPVSSPAPESSANPGMQPHAASLVSSSAGRIKASPLARKIAEQRNVNLASLRGSGPSGRIVASDVEGAAPPESQPGVVARSIPAELPASGVAPSGGTLTPFSKMRDTIARRMQESVVQAPHFYVTASVNMGEARRLKEVVGADPSFKGLSFNHLIIKAAAYGISKERRVNRAVRDNQMFEPGHINIGIITALDDGLIIPVLKDVDKMSLRDLVFEARAAVERARAGRPTAQDLVGGTFSISNLGMFDVDSFTAIINPGQGAVLAVSSIREEPLVAHAHVVPGWVMKATVSVDHRVIDGVIAGGFLKAFKQALEVPALLMM